jgi:DNA polymerase-3 subunit delta
VKLTGSAIAPCLARPPDDLAAILVFGPDDGLARERAAAAIRGVLGKDIDDPFRLAILEADALRQDPALLPDEAAQLSLLGGRRVIRLRGADDRTAKPLALVLAAPPGGALVVVEAGDLGPASALRKLVEAAPNAAAIGCYADGPAEIGQLLRDAAREHKIRIADDAMDYLVVSLGGDRLVTRQEVEKLMLFAGSGGTVTLDDALATIGDSANLAIDDVVHAAFEGNAAAAETGISRLFLEGENPVTLVRAAQRHAQRLHLSATKIESGEAKDRIVASLHLFHKTAARFRQQIDRWTKRRAGTAISVLTQAEFDCKTTGYPAETICRQALVTVARLARAGGQR